MDGTWETSAEERKLCGVEKYDCQAVKGVHRSNALLKKTHAPTCDQRKNKNQKKPSKVNIFKSADSVAHTRTACSLSFAADYFFFFESQRY